MSTKQIIDLTGDEESAQPNATTKRKVQCDTEEVAEQNDAVPPRKNRRCSHLTQDRYLRPMNVVLIEDLTEGEDQPRSPDKDDDEPQFCDICQVDLPCGGGCLDNDGCIIC